MHVKSDFLGPCKNDGYKNCNQIRPSAKGERPVFHVMKTTSDGLGESPVRVAIGSVTGQSLGDTNGSQNKAGTAGGRLVQAAFEPIQRATREPVGRLRQEVMGNRNFRMDSKQW